MIVVIEQESEALDEILKRIDEDEYWNPSKEIDDYELQKRIEIQKMIEAFELRG